MLEYQTRTNPHTTKYISIIRFVFVSVDILPVKKNLKTGKTKQYVKDETRDIHKSQLCQ